MNWIFAELAKTLAGLYYTQEMIVALLLRAGLSPGDYNLNGNAGLVFTLMLKRLVDTGLENKLISVALSEYSSNPVLLDALSEKSIDEWRKSVYAGPIIDYGKEPINPRLEKLIERQSTLLPISFLNQGTAAAKSVARIVTPEGLGTGFLISSGNFLLTNNHVLPSKAMLQNVEVNFNYQRNMNGEPEMHRSYNCDPGFFETSEADDWSLVRLRDNPVADFSFLTLNAQLPRVGNYVNIIQHPGGEYKQIGIYHNVVNYVAEDRIRYFTDTLPGSSGSPVFNSCWEVIALHHSGGYFPVKEGGHILCNEGIAISRLLGRLSKFL